MNESDMPNMLVTSIDVADLADFLESEQANDEERFRSTIEQILRKCENGMCTQDDVFELRACFKYYGIDV